MAISRVFGGTNIFIPGAYDTKNVILTGGVPSIAVGKVAIIGESDKGRPGEILQFSPEALTDLISEYGSGPIVDAAKLLVAPSNDGRITNGASAIYVYKTNSSTKSEVALQNDSAEAFGTASAISFGVAGNMVSLELTKQDAVQGTIVGSAVDLTVGSFASGEEFGVIELGSGVVNTFTMPVLVSDDIAGLEAALADGANWSGGLPTDTTFTVSGTDDAAIVTVSMSDDATDHELGAGRVVELVAGSLATTLGLAAGGIQSVSEAKMRVQTSDGTNVEDSDDTLGNIAGDIYLEVGATDGVAATMTIDATTITFTGTSAFVLQKADFATLDQLADFVNAKSTLIARVPAGINGGLSPAILDRVASLGITPSAGSGLYAGRVKADSFAFKDYFDKYSAIVDIELSLSRGLPAETTGKVFLSGAVKGASASADFSAALQAFEDVEDVDIIVPLVSQDASDDLAEDSSYTDSASSYDVESVHAATRSHCKKMSTVKARKERVCYLGYRGTFSECKAQSLALNTEQASMLIQDVQVDTIAGLQWRQPHMAAVIAAGMQAGGDIGQPTTFKSINALAIRHRAKQGVAITDVTEEFKRSKMDQAIEAGIFPLEAPSTGGIRIVVQNATYSKDNNFVYNRPSVLSAMNYVAKTMRASLETKFIGTKARTATLSNIKADIEGLMADFLRSDIIVGDDTNGGLGYKDLTLILQGNTVLVDITVTPVQGVDFIFTNIAIDNIQVAA